MKMFYSIFAALTFAISLSAADTNAPVSSKTVSPAPFKIGALAATNYFDQMMIVTGKVVQVTIRPSVTFLNLDRKYPDSPFAIVVIHGKSSYYGDANALKGKSIEIRGKIKNYKGKPEIVLDSTNQLTVLDSKRLVDPTLTLPATNVVPNLSATNNLPEIL